MIRKGFRRNRRRNGRSRIRSKTNQLKPILILSDECAGPVEEWEPCHWFFGQSSLVPRSSQDCNGPKPDEGGKDSRSTSSMKTRLDASASPSAWSGSTGRSAASEGRGHGSSARQKPADVELPTCMAPTLSPVGVVSISPTRPNEWRRQIAFFIELRPSA